MYLARGWMKVPQHRNYSGSLPMPTFPRGPPRSDVEEAILLSVQNTEPRLVDGKGVVGGDELGTGANEGLGASAGAQEELVGGEALLGGEVGDELGDVGVERLTRLGRHEAIHVHLAVLALVQVPGGAGDGGRRDRAARRRDRARAPDRAEPDHDLELVVALCRRRCEQVVRHVRDHALAGVAGYGKALINAPF